MWIINWQCLDAETPSICNLGGHQFSGMQRCGRVLCRSSSGMCQSGSPVRPPQGSCPARMQGMTSMNDLHARTLACPNRVHGLYALRYETHDLPTLSV